jgi:hypothetical protein
MESNLIGAVIEAQNLTSQLLVIDKARGGANGYNQNTVYICVDSDGKVTSVPYTNVKKVLSFENNPSLFIQKNK